MALLLRADALSLELWPEIGGCIGAFRIERRGGPFDLMRPFGRSPGKLSDALYSGMFPMLPFANCIRDNCFRFEGQRYEVASNMAGARLNFHGSGWQSPWRIASVSEAVAVLVLDEGRVDKAYCFSAVQRFSIDRAGLTVETTLTNRADRRMPFSFGQHPWFPTHDGALVRFAATGMWLSDREGQTERVVPITAEADYATPRRPPSAYCNVCYAGWDSHAEVVWLDAGVRLSLTADAVFRHLMFHVPGNQPVFCLEPQSNAPCAFDGLDHGGVAPGVHILGPGANVSGSLRFDVST
jgi:aldose 1-epimerase